MTGGAGRHERSSRPYSGKSDKPFFKKRNDSDGEETPKRFGRPQHSFNRFSGNGSNRGFRKSFDRDGARGERDEERRFERPARRFERNENRPVRRFNREDEERPARRFSRDGGRGFEHSDGKFERPARRFERNEERPARNFNRGEEHPQRPYASEWTPTEEFIRLNRFISNSGVCSRREADEFIQTGLVTVNGEIVTELGIKVKMTDDIRFNGERLKGEPRVYIVMNKPKGYVTTMDDPHADKTVMDLISKADCPHRVYPVGRLDKATSGVLMFTNDGELADKLMHPSYGATKIYHVFLDKNLKKADFDAILNGIELEDGEIHADSLSYVDGDLAQVGIQIHSGRNRIVRRIFEHLGYSVKKLDRVYFAGLTKKALERGAWRFLTETEIAKFKMGSFE